MLDIVCRTAVVAGEAILKVYAEEFDVRHKTDKTPVTEADLAAERIIVDRLMSAFPDIPCIAEELCESEGMPPCCDRFWAIDPLDGTKEFIARNGEFAVLIALVEEGRPVLGVVHGPAVGLTYGLVIVHSRSHENSRRLAEFLQDYPVLGRKTCGSALKFGVIASGEADLYPRFGTTMEWDTAAGQAILEAAGGGVETLTGEPLAYGKPGFKNDGFLAWGRRPGN
jgi:3'(2'), 5'-bisphosphate nucleotidase